MNGAASPSVAYETRRQLNRALALGLVAFGAEIKSALPGMSELQRRKALPAALVAAIGGELTATIGYLAMGRWAYGSAALVRQLVEVEYLAWAITHDPDDAWEWFDADRPTRLNRWQPGKIRQRSAGRFPNTDYHDHCEIGGHPVPGPAMKILDARDVWVELSLYEAAHHGIAIWHYLLQGLDGLPPMGAIDQHHIDIDHAYDMWRTNETLSKALFIE